MRRLLGYVMIFTFAVVIIGGTIGRLGFVGALRAWGFAALMTSLFVGGLHLLMDRS